MTADVISAFSDKRILDKRPSKESLNHAGLVYLASGIDPYVDTPAAYLGAYRSLGIDILNRVPSQNVVRRLRPGESRKHDAHHRRAYLGLYDTFFREVYPYTDADEFFADDDFDLDYRKLIVPVPHCFDLDLIRKKTASAGEIGLYYYMLYTTLFMWGVEYLGWEVFMVAASLEPELFDQKFLEPAFEASLELITELSEVEIPYVFVHDDLAEKKGPVFHPDWYDRYIFPRYKELWKPIKDRGKKVIFVADGNMDCFLANLKASGVDGVMLENPATNFDRILDVFGDGIIICGMDTTLLTFGTPLEISAAVDLISRKTRGIPGFALCSPGGLHNNIPIENLIAYYDARVRANFTKENWRKGDIDYARNLVRD